VDHRAGTHDAGLEGDIQRGIQQAVVLQHQPTLAQGHDFGVSGGIVTANRAVPAFANHLIIVYQHGANGHFALFPGASGKLECVVHPVFMIVFEVGQR